MEERAGHVGADLLDFAEKQRKKQHKRQKSVGRGAFPVQSNRRWEMGSGRGATESDLPLF